MAQFVSGLKSRNEETRTKTANELHHFVSTELREMPIEEHTRFMDEFNHHIFELVSSNDLNERKGGILAIGEAIYEFLHVYILTWQYRSGILNALKKQAHVFL